MQSLCFSDKIVPSLQIQNEDDVEELLKNFGGGKNPEHVLRTASLDQLKAAVVAKLERWAADESFDGYEAHNVNNLGHINPYAIIVSTRSTGQMAWDQSPQNPKGALSGVGFPVGYLRRQA